MGLSVFATKKSQLHRHRMLNIYWSVYSVPADRPVLETNRAEDKTN